MRGPLAFALIALVLAVVVVLRWQVSSDITHFLPAGRDHALAQLSRQLADSPLTRTLIVSVEAADESAAVAAARTLAAEVSAAPEVAWVQRGPTQAQGEAVYKLYAARAAFFVSDEPERTLPPALTDAGLAEKARALKLALSSPLAPLLSRLAPRDPLQWFPAILKRMEAAQAGALEVVGEQFLTHDHRHAIVFVGSAHPAFDGEANRHLLAAVHRGFEKARAEAPGADLRLELAGVAPIAVDAEARMRRDLERLSIASTLGVLLLFWLFFGELRGVLLGLLPLVGGALAAGAVGLLVFGRLHALTLAIGSSLMGVALDYPILFLTHRALAPEEPSVSVARRVWMGILIGGVTTAAGFAALGWSSFPGVREVALTSSIGMLSALVVTRGVLPALTERARRPRSLARASRLAGQWLASVERHPRASWAAVVLALGVSVAGIPRVQWLDSLEALNAADPALKAETDRVRARVSQVEDGRLVVVRGADEEEALRRNDHLALRLAGAVKAGHVDGVLSLHAFLWSRALQERNRALVTAAPALAARATEALREAGFRAETFGPFARELAALAGNEAPAPLTLADLQQSPLAPLVRPFVLPLGKEVGVLTFLRGVHDREALRRAVEELPGATLFEQRAFLDETYARFRVQTLQALGLGLGVIALILLLRYRRLRVAVAALAPAVLAASSTLGLFGLLGLKANLLHVLSLLLVLSMGVDYGVFLAESKATRPGQPGHDLEATHATLAAMLAACATTVLSFGLLAISSTPALRAIGLTVGLGIVASLLLAPLALRLNRS